MIRPAMLRACAATALALSAMAAAGCGDDEDGEPTRAAGETAEATGTAGADRDISSGIRSVDSAVAAVLAADEEAVRGMVVFQLVPCVVEQMGIGAPPLCREGEADGTPVEVLPSAQCEGFFVRPDELQLDAVVPPSAELYGVYRAPAEYFPPGLYSAVFVAGSDAEPPIDAYEVILDNEGIKGINYGCAEEAAQLVETRGLTDALVPPE